MEKAGHIVATLFISREQAHREHLRTTSLGHHLALGKFYEQLVEFADRFAETAQGLYGVLNIPYLQPAQGNIVSVLEQHVSSIESCRKAFTETEESPLLNIIDEISGLYSQTLYLLSRFK